MIIRKVNILLFLLGILQISAINSKMENQYNKDIAMSNDGITALMLAVEGGDIDLCKDILSKKADVSAKDKNGNTAISRAVDKKNRDIIKLLLDNGADLFVANNNGEIPWIKALEENDEDFIQFLRTYKPLNKKRLMHETLLYASINKNK